MIKTFRDKATETLFDTGFHPRFGNASRAAFRKLQILDATNTLDSLRIPSGNSLEALKGDRAGQFSIRVNDRWRLCFVWSNQDAFDVEIVDYH